MHSDEKRNPNNMAFNKMAPSGHSLTANVNKNFVARKGSSVLSEFGDDGATDETKRCE